MKASLASDPEGENKRIGPQLPNIGALIIRIRRVWGNN